MTTKTNKKKVATTTTKSKGNVAGSQGLTAQQVAALVKAGGMVFSSARMKKLKKKYEGDPVAVATGEVVDDAVDLIFPTVLPMAWIRIYSSFSAKDATPLGRGGFTHSFHQYVEETRAGIVVRLDDGTDAVFPKLAAGEHAFHRGARRTLFRRVGDRYEVYDHDARLTHEYEPVEEGRERAMLRAVEDAWGNRQELFYDARALWRVVDPSGRELRLVSDSKGRILAVEAWAHGEMQQSVTYTYTDEGELTAATDALGYTESYLYDGHHRMIQKARSNGFRLHYEYSPTGGQCVRTWGDGGLYTVELVFDADEKQTTTHGNPKPMIFTWNDKGDVVRSETFDGQFVDEVVYDDDSYVLENRDAAGRVVKVEYDERGNRIRHIDPLGVVTEWEYDGDLPTREMRDGFVMSELRWDERGSLLDMSEASGAALFFDHDNRGRLVRVSSKNDMVARYVYDDEHNLIEEHDGLGGVTRYGYDALGFPVWETDAAGCTVYYEYDALRRRTVTRFPDGRREVLRYGPLMLPIEHEAQDGGITRIEYIGTGKPVRIVRSDGEAWNFRYDKIERLIAIENAKAEVYELRWDARGLLIEERTFDGRTMTYQQSKIGATARIDLPDGNYQVYVRDLAGRLLELRTPDSAVTYKRDRYGRVLEAVAEDAFRKVTTTFEYDERGFISAVTQDGRTIRYEVNPYGFVTARTMPSGQTTHYYWSVLDALTAVDHAGHKILFQHDAAGWEQRRYIYDAGVDVLSSYDTMRRLAEQTVVALGANGTVLRVLSQRRFTYGPMGRLEALSDSRFGVMQFTYDDLGRPTEESRKGHKRRFEYDVVGSLVGVFEGNAVGPLWRTDAGGVLIRTPDAEFENDILRHRRSKVRCVDHRPTNDRTEYAWDSMGQLRQIVLPGGETIRFFYDAFGRRVRKEIHPPEPPYSPDESPAPPPLPRVVEYLWDEDVVAAEMDSEGGERVYVHIPGSFTPVLHEDDGRVLYYITDALGVPKELIDAQGEVVWAAAHGPRGEIVDAFLAERAAGERLPGTPFRWPGVFEDEETGLFYVRFRYADPSTGRWLSPDPLGIFGDKNLFSFHTIDPFGLGVDTTPTDFGTHPLQPAIDEFRIKNPKVTVGQNVAAFQVGDKTVAMASEKGKHSESRIFNIMDQEGANRSQVSSAFTELEPCSGCGMNGCKDKCESLPKNSKTSWSFEYPEALDPRKAPKKAKLAQKRRRVAVAQKRKAVTARMKKFGVSLK